MYHFDVLFLDVSANKYFDRQVLEKHPLGGTEASIIRVAEGLASLGLKICVMQSRCSYFEAVMGQHCFFMHSNDLDKVSTMNFVQIRDAKNSHLFQDAKKYVWCHDLGHDAMKDWIGKLKIHDVTVVAVSRWHRQNLKKYLDNYEKTTYIYNPVPTNIFIDQDKRVPYDKNLLVWCASPHKGLGKAIELFRKLRNERPKLQLIIFNPGYYELDTITEPGTAVYGPTNCQLLWTQMSRSLCVFYPCEWDETFGLIAAEANAMGVPIATYRRGALKEIVSSDNQMVEQDDEQAFMDMVLKWNTEGRPNNIYGQEEFKLDSVIMDWVRMLAK